MRILTRRLRLCGPLYDWQIGAVEIMRVDVSVALRALAREYVSGRRPFLEVVWPARRLYHLVRDFASAVVIARRGVPFHVVLFAFLVSLFTLATWIYQDRWGYVSLSGAVGVCGFIL